MSTAKKTTRRRRPAAATTRARTKQNPAPAEMPPTAPVPAEPSESAIAVLEASPEERGIPVSSPEPIFAARVPPPEAERPFPAQRRAIFFDVENTSRAQHIARMLDHLQIDRRGQRTEFVAVGNWRVIGHDTARLLARHGAHLVHSAPSVGVRDWSDLRIAVAAGAWLAGARPGHAIEIPSAHRAFDAVGDVASSLGILFRRLSYRGLAGAPVEHVTRPVAEPAASEARASSGDGRSSSGDRRDHRHRGRYRGRRDGRSAPPQRPAA